MLICWLLRRAPRVVIRASPTPAPELGDTQLPSTLTSLLCQENAGSHPLRDLRIPSWSSWTKGREAGHRLRLQGLWGDCWNQGTKSEPHSPSREQPEGMQLEPGLAGAEGSPLPTPPRLPGLPGPSPIPCLTPSAHLLPAHHPRPPTSYPLRTYLQPSAPTPARCLHLQAASLIAF